jgi:hypothetical protein
MWTLIVLIVGVVLPLIFLKLDDVMEWGLTRPFRPSPASTTPQSTATQNWLDLLTSRPFVQLMATVFGLFLGGYIIISGAYSPGTVTTAGGIVGMIFGYWLK